MVVVYHHKNKNSRHHAISWLDGPNYKNDYHLGNEEISPSGGTYLQDLAIPAIAS